MDAGESSDGMDRCKRVSQLERPGTEIPLYTFPFYLRLDFVQYYITS